MNLLLAMQQQPQMSEESSSNEAATVAPAICKCGCGFYASPQFDGMCSVCYKAAAAGDTASVSVATAASGAAAETVPLLGNSSPVPVPEADIAQASIDEGESSMPPPPLPPPQQQIALPPESIAAMLALPPDDGAASQGASSDASSSGGGSVGGGSCELKRRNRCHACKKRVGLTGFECRCGGTYCPAHRYSDKHDCSFDYRTHGRHEIRKANPQVLSRKVERL